MLENKIQKLKRFIEIADQEVFGKNVCRVYVDSRRYNDKFFAAFWKVNSTKFEFFGLLFVYIKLWAIFLLSSVLVFLLSIGKGGALRERREFRIEKLKWGGMLAHHLRTWHSEWYTITRHPAFCKFDDWILAEFAWHEVRHRIQRHFGYQEEFDEHEIVHEIFIERQGEICTRLEEGGKYEPSEFPVEIDARVSSYTLVDLMSNLFPDADEVTEDMFRETTRKYRDFFMAKTPILE